MSAALVSAPAMMASDVRPAKRLPVTEVGFEEYDVFLCHRGPDTKTAFVSFLYDRLEAAGLRPFLDCKSIGKGQHSQAWMDSAVKTTPIALVIFSENFADSEWCLNELKVMLDTPGVKVLPVFYKVQPDEVCCPEEGRLSAAFEKLKRRHDETSIERWRDALKRASGLNGWVYEAAGQSLETDLVTAIVREVSELASKPLPLDVGDYVFGTEEVVDGIIQKHMGVLILVIWGMGGIGKSTLARELYNRMREEFAASCYVEDLKSYYVQDSKNKVIRDDDIVKVQKHILKYLCPGEGLEVENKHKGKVILEERLSKKRILVVLDDVPDNGELYYWISRKMLTEGSMCIVTTRNRRVVEKLNKFDMKEAVHFHKVQGLGSEDSKRVFASYAFGRHWNDKPPGFGELVAEISEACRGVPLVLKVCGALLKGREDAGFWSEVLMELKSGTFDDDGISDCLKISFNALDQEYQDMFLDITCVLLGKPRDMAILAWKSHGWYPIMGIQTLVDRALVTVDNSGCFRMHDHLRDMGRQILKEQRSKGVINRLSMPESLEYLREYKGFPESLEVLNIINMDSSTLLTLDISRMKNLRILMCDDTITATSIPENLCWWNLDGRLFRRLFCLSEESAKGVMTTLPTPHPNNKLAVLSLADSPITTLTEIVVRLRNLEVLYLWKCRELHLLPESFGDLSKLRDLNLRWSGITSLPASFGELSNLEVLNRCGCGKLDLLPESFGGLSKLRELNLTGSGITSLPASFGELRNVDTLNLEGCGKLRLLTKSFGGLSKLRDLNLKLSGIKSLPASFGELSNLEVLNLKACLKLHLLPESFGGLSKLRDLKLRRSGIRCLPATFGELSNLDTLNLRQCSKLRLLPESFGGLNKLRDLNLNGSAITSLPASFGELSNLEVLDVGGCWKLRLLPKSFGGFSKLRDLNMGWSGITSLPASFGELSNLEVLNLWGCWELDLLPESFGGLSKLRVLNLAGLWITSLPASFGELSNLEVLDLRGCRELHLLPESFGGLSKLRYLNLDYSRITTLPASFAELKSPAMLEAGFATRVIWGCQQALRLEFELFWDHKLTCVIWRAHATTELVWCMVIVVG
ncbi:hypothetical protein KC19_9G049900 [Ceratodon purpureus]|uniref:TIR domain-containing protein n=1 Tax=Ceratodon purpureus TaxID=3225 RepID=A0A8T0GSY1_CERPU|nr:hypothetical protein KC19_9G049900 [Ceratodon purpureus]